MRMLRDIRDDAGKEIFLSAALSFESLPLLIKRNNHAGCGHCTGDL